MDASYFYFKGEELVTSLIDLIKQQKNIQQLISKLGKGQAHLLTGIAGSARALLSYALFEEKQEQIIWLTQNSFHASKLANELSNLVPEDQLHVFETNDVIHAEMAFASPESQAERVSTMNFLLSDKPGIVIVPLAGLRKLLPPKALFKEMPILIDMESELDIDDLSQKLVKMGYVHDQKVAKPGEFSIRGGIIDIYPIAQDNPVRIELFDVEVDSMRFFDVADQRSIENIDSMTILPAQDYFLTNDYQEQALKRFDKKRDYTMEKIRDDELKNQLAQNMTRIEDALKNNESIDELVQFVDLLYPETASILDYISDSAILMIDEYPRVLENNAMLNEEEAQWVTEQISRGKTLHDLAYSKDLKDVLNKKQQPKLYFSLFQKGMGSLKLDSIIPIHYRQMQKFFGQMPMIKTEMERYAKQNFTTVVMAEDAERVEKIHQTFSDFDIPHVLSEADDITKGLIQLIPETISEGFELINEKIAVLTEKDLFNRVQKKKVRRTKMSNAERLKSYNELSPGDFVVHVHHGIGEYKGMETMEIGGVHQDYLSIAYDKGSKLFIPVTQLNLLQKYVASEGKSPKINKLGGTSWAKTKRKVQTQVEDIADDLIELYATRESQKGYAYPKDNAYQQEFENAFPYSETEDQLRSIEEIKKDMQNDKPMDRLLVGDVGYGKTEVAIRAIFKAIQEGKQAAFLVPTTVLAQQHYETLIQRFIDFPVEVGLLSRFKTKKEIEQTIDGLKKGTVDVVVGTHRILSKDVSFLDLGLLIVDEEQRFGVKHKERLKELKSQVDVLTLTATPIPRTLHMSMLGVRDLSVIETPPANRYPVQTYVMEMNSLVVKEAIEREMARDGQVFFLHNRVSTIEKRVNELKSIAPEARISYVHGQMSENQLEERLFEFLSGEYDVLVTTTIIETGVDMPNVNTLIVEDADRMGLSQLYQLRGRVGRSNRIAYAYFMHQPDKVLTEVSENRLQAIKDFTELGSGFKIAMRDLSIRGAGNLLGKQQHGFIDAVGFDLYSQMLEEAVARKRGQKTIKKTATELDLNIDAYLPTDYVSDQSQKIELYKRIRQFEKEEDYTDLQDELIDRFGEYPTEVADLLKVGLLKYYSENSLIEKIERKPKRIHIVFSKGSQETFPLPELFKALKDVPIKTDMQTEGQLEIIFILTARTEQSTWVDGLLTFTQSLSNYRDNIEETSAEDDSIED